MRCKKHVSDQSSTVGVCATCLRERLSAFIRSQALMLEELQPDPVQNPNPDPPPLIFPRSVSPYRSVNPTRFSLFYPTPLVDPAHHRRKKTGSNNKFGFISKLFRSRSEKSRPFDYNCYHNYRVGPTAKGMSPEREAGEESSPARSFPRPSPGRVRPGPARSNSLGFCLSPLVRPSPARQWCAGEEKGGGAHPSLSDAGRYCANRSRKLADFGRLNGTR